MAARKSIKLLPSIFQTDANEKFLSATIDQLISEPTLKNLHGYVGRTFAPTFKNTDSYIPELTADRQHYQLEPSTLIKNEQDEITFFASYIDFLNKIRYYGGYTNDHSRLFDSEYYSFNPRISFDKFVNFSQYYWLPDGPAPVDVGTTGVELVDTFTVTRNDSTNKYEFASDTVDSTAITLARGGTYTFKVAQDSKFWIQSELGIDGKINATPTLSTRDVLGVENNGATSGEIVFNVPQKTAQDRFLAMELVYSVDYATPFNILPYNDFHNQLLSTFLDNYPQYTGITGSLNGKHLVFVDVGLADNAGDESWTDAAVVYATPTATGNVGTSTITVSSTDKLIANLVVAGTGIPSNTTITGIDQANSTVTLSGTLTANASGTYTFTSSIYTGGTLVPEAQRYGVWKVQFIASGIANDPILRFVWVQDVAINEKVYVKYGVANANKEFYKEYDGLMQQVPHITCVQDTLYIQDGSNPSIYAAVKIVDYNNFVVDVENDILGKETYTSPNGVKFTSGLKIKFDVDVTPEKYQNKEWYVENVGDSIRLTDPDWLVTPEAYNDELAINYPDQTFPEYITIKRDALDVNAWSRNNRWFHVDVITQTAAYRNESPAPDQRLRAQRPIVQFEGDLRLYNYGRVGKEPIDILDTITSDAFNSLEGKVLTTIAGVEIFSGMRVLFAADVDPLVRDTIYTVNLVQYAVDNLGLPTGDRHIKLVAADDGASEQYDSVVVKAGQYKGSQWWYDGSQWLEAQQKSQLQQDPLFDVREYDPITATSGASFSDTIKYPRSTFKGTRIFGYQRKSTLVFDGINVSYIDDTGTPDSVLGFSLSYRNFQAQGDILFANYFNTDTFEYIVDQIAITTDVNSGFLESINSKTDTSIKNTWNTVVEPSKQYQILTFIYDGTNNPFTLDISPESSSSIPYVKVYQNEIYLKSNQWTRIDDKLTVTNGLTDGDVITVQIYSTTPSDSGYYEIPLNLDLNAQNTDIDALTLGQIRNHLVALSRNSTTLVGDVLGPNNLRDIEIKSQGGSILQHSAPLPLAELFLLDDQANAIDAIRFAQREYSKFKNKFLELSSSLVGIQPTDPVASVDLILAEINKNKNTTFPFYYSDMVPYGTFRYEDPYTVFDPLVDTYQIKNIFSDVILSNQAVLVYFTPVSTGVKEQLIKNYHYSFNSDSPSVTFNFNNIELNVEDVILFVTYNNTDGSYVPETPTKLGMFPKFQPEIFEDDTYRETIDVVRGHDGSTTPAFGDYRDNFLLELELRIYNNIKVPDTGTYQDTYAVNPGKFRTTDYNYKEVWKLLGQGFLTWVGNNKIDYTANSTFASNDGFTWNYENFVDRIDGEYMPGSWRACYQYFYDTIYPHTRPWEMLGFTEKPNWWESYYGPGPYTGGNELLWNDLENGIIRDGVRSVFGPDENYMRPGLSQIIPVDENGFLKSPEQIIARATNPTKAANSWSVGQLGPVEWAWRTSSDFPYAVQLALAVAKPARFFSQLIDTYRIYYNYNLNQYLTLDNHHMRQTDVTFNGDTSSGTIHRSAGYLNYIADYLRNLGIDPSTKITSMLANYSVNLAYKMSGFTDKKYLQILAEQSSPTSTNESVMIPNENYDVYLYKSTPTAKIVYSGVIIEKATNGYSVRGYGTGNPYFTIIPSIVNSNAYKINVLNLSGTVFNDYQNVKLNVPYGYEFKTPQQVVDFLISYERYLEAQGFIFTDRDGDLGETRDWRLSVKEFLFWAQQGWKAGSILVLSPVLNTINAITDGSVVDGIQDSQYGSKILDQNFNLIKNTAYNVMRTPTTFKVNLSDEASVIAYAEFDLVQYEHVLTFDNTTVFNDVIYKPELGNRQYRLKIIGQKTDLWDGSLYAPGYIYNSDTVQSWQSSKDYLKGELVTYKNQYYVALQNIIASVDFNFAYWKLLANNEIKTGLLNNLSTIAVGSKSYYDSYGYFKDNNQLQYSHGLIGFKPRQYLNDLGLSETTQIEFYKGYIKQKGSANAVDALAQAQFNNLNSKIEYFEEWAVRTGEYGALNSNPYLEIALDEKKFSVNPQSVEFVGLDRNNDGDGLTIFNKSQLYKSTNQFVGNIALNRDDNSDYDQDIPVAGYVNIDDVDAQVFDIADYQNLNIDLDNIGTGYTIWCAKDFTGNWNVYRVTETDNHVVELANSLDGFISWTMDTPHALEVDNVFLVKNFNTKFDGFYQVYKVVNLTTVMVKYLGDTANLDELTTQTGFSLFFKLNSSRFVYMEDARVFNYNGNPPHGWLAGEKIWIDDDAATNAVQGQPYTTGDNLWKVYEKTFPWNYNQTIKKASSEYAADDGFGTCIKLSYDGLLATTGSPYANTTQWWSTTLPNPLITTGIVHTFDKNNTGQFVEGLSLVPNAGNANVVTREFGYYVDQAIEKVVIGAPGSFGNVGFVYVYNRPAGTTTYNISQVLVGSNLTSRFGTSIAYDQNGTWLYIGAPGNTAVDCGNVYAYGLNTHVSTQQHTEIVNDQTIIKLSGSYTVGASDILTQPATGARVTIKNSGTVSNLTVSSLTNIITDATFGNINLNATISANVGDYITQSTSGANLYVSQGVLIDTRVYGIYQSGVKFDTTGNIAINGGNLTIKPSFVGSGNIFINDIDTGLYANINYSTSVTSSINVSSSFVPEVANVASSLLITNSFRTFIPDIDYTLTGNVITFKGGNLVADNYTVKQQPYYTLQQVLTNSNVGSEFGYAMDSSLDGAQLAVGAPNDNVIGLPGAGAVYVYDRVIEAFKSTGGRDYTTRGNIDLAHRVTVDGIETLDYTVFSSNVIRFNESPTVGKVVYVETNQFNLLEKLIGINDLFGGLAAIQANTRFGTSMTICSNNCAIYVGAPFYDNGTTYNTGAVWKFHNRGRLYGTNTGYTLNPTFTVGDTIRLDNFEVTVANISTPASSVASLDDLVACINNANILGVTAVNAAGYLSINTDKTVAKNLLRILSGSNLAGGTGVSNVFKDADMAIFAYMQIIVNPFNAPGEYFGNRVILAQNAYMLVISSDRGTTKARMTFDTSATYFDDKSTAWYDSIKGSGSVYIYELYDDPRNEVEHPGRYAYAQQLSIPDFDTATGNDRLNFGDKFGTSIDIIGGEILVSAPGDDTTLENAGSLYLFSNPALTRGWNLVRYEKPKVDLYTVNRAYLYNNLTNTILTNIEFIDPAKGKILGQAEQEITYKTINDPAIYNRGIGEDINTNLYWSENQLDQVWWNLDKVRFVDYEQGDLSYRSINWGRLFPGSTVEVLEWVESTVIPSQYVAAGYDGVPKYADDSAYVEITYVDQTTNIITSKYYFWVKDKASLTGVNKKRTLPILAIQDLIENPKAQDIPYGAIIQNNALILYNIGKYLSAQNTILHVDYEELKNNSIIHGEYELLQKGNPFSYIPEKISNKLIDSLAGSDMLGAVVPDPLLSLADRYGISVRPRQSMFIDRLQALADLTSYVNSILIDYPIARQYNLNQLNAEEPQPLSYAVSAILGEYDFKVSTEIDLNYIDTTNLDAGYKVLVNQDTTQDNLWVIYELQTDSTWEIVKVQSYRTNLYWEYVDWYGFKPDGITRYALTDKLDYVVDTLVDAKKLPIVSGEEILVRVNASDLGGWNIITVNDQLDLVVVGIENGTIQLNDSLGDFAGNELGFSNQGFSSRRYDQNPNIEIRNIIQALKDDIFVNELDGEYNKTFFVMMNYLFTEQKYVDWIFKSSFISVKHHLRSLAQPANYIKDNQTYYQSYVDEVKPYITKVREYLTNYDGTDEYTGSITDFDLAPYYDPEMKIFRSPSGEEAAKDQQLWATGYLTSTGQLINQDYPRWYAARNAGIDRIVLSTPGSGYTVEPTVTIIGGGSGVVAAKATATFDFDTGKILSITITNPGSGYFETPTIIINGSCDTPATAYAVLKNGQVRTFDTTIKFDRISYGTTVEQWTANTFYTANTIISYGGIGYQVTSNITTGNTFISNEYAVYPAANFDNANDRIMAYYDPSKTMLAKDLNQLVDGIEYPGVQIQGPDFSISPLFGGILDISKFDSVEYDEDGNPILSQSDVDTIIRSTYLDSSLGTRPEDIDVDGGKYVDRYSSHAPEELIPGIIYDTLDMKVYTKINANVDTIGYRIFNRSFQIFGNAANDTNTINETSYIRIADDYSTKLTAPLFITDTEIRVEDATKLPTGNREFSQPAVIFINGERITYYRNYAREVTPWVANVFYANSSVISYSGNNYITTANVNSATFDSGNVTQLTSINVLTQLRRSTAGTGAPDKHNAGMYVIDGGEDQVILRTVIGSNILVSNVNVTVNTSNVSNVYVRTITANTALNTTNVWYNLGATTATDGTGFNGATTDPVLFLKAHVANMLVIGTVSEEIITEDAINTLTTEDGNTIIEEDQ